MENFRQLCATYLYPLLETFVLSRIKEDAYPPELETHKYGNDKSDNILFFIHGFPDNHSLWNHQINAFKNDYLCYSITLPNYNANNIDYTNKYGYDWPIVAKIIANKLIEISKENNDNILKPKSITLIMHDFGTMINKILINLAVFIFGIMINKILINLLVSCMIPIQQNIKHIL